MNLTPEQRAAALEVVAEIKADPEYAERTDLHEKVAGIERKLGGGGGAVPLTPERQAKVKKRYEETKLPEGPVGGSDLLGYVGDSAKGVGRQLHGMGAAALQSLPAVVPAIEAAGDLLQEGFRGYPTARKIAGAIVPPSGTTEGAIQEAPLPIAARAFGALSPMAAATGAAGAAPGVVTRVMERITPQVVQRAAATTGQALNLAQTPATVAYQAIQKQAARLPLVGPGTSHGIAGVATGGLTGAVDAGLRRVAPAALGQEVPPVDVPREIGLPALAGGLGAAIPGVHNMMTRKGFQPTEGSRTANKFIEVKRSGREKDPNDLLFDTAMGDEGVNDVAMKGKRLIADAEARGKGAIEGSKKALSDVEASEPGIIGEAAAKTEPRVRQTLSAQDAANRKAFEDGIAKYEDDHIPQGNLFADMDKLVATKANEAGKYLNSGERLKEAWSKIKGFIDTGRVRDYRTALTELKTLAERGTPEQAWVAQQLHGGIKEHLKAEHPGVAQVYEEYRGAQNKTGRGFNTVYGEESPRDIGQKSPDPDDPYIDVLPTQEVAARKRLTKVGDTSAEGEAWKPAFEELGGLGLKSHLDTIRQARERIAKNKSEAEGRLASTTEQAEQDKLLAEEMGTEALEAKHAVEMSRFPGFTEVLSPVAQGITAMTGHNPAHSAAVAGMAGATFLRRLKQFGQSNIALGLDPLAQPGLPVGLASQAAASQEIKKARERITGKGLVEQARAAGAKVKKKYNELTSE